MQALIIGIVTGAFIAQLDDSRDRILLCEEYIRASKEELKSARRLNLHGIRGLRRICGIHYIR